MAPDRRRPDDPDGSDWREFRHQSQDEIRLGYHGTTFSAKGVGVYLALAVGLLVGATMYAGYRVEVAIRDLRKADLAEHVSIARAADRTACVVLMTPEGRVRFQQDYAPGAFQKWCPWMEDDAKFK